jgi:hypothetical protein
MGVVNLNNVTASQLATLKLGLELQSFVVSETTPAAKISTVSVDLVKTQPIPLMMAGVASISITDINNAALTIPAATAINALLANSVKGLAVSNVGGMQQATNIANTSIAAAMSDDVRAAAIVTTESNNLSSITFNTDTTTAPGAAASLAPVISLNIAKVNSSTGTNTVSAAESSSGSAVSMTAGTNGNIIAAGIAGNTLMLNIVDSETTNPILGTTAAILLTLPSYSGYSSITATEINSDGSTGPISTLTKVSGTGADFSGSIVVNSTYTINPANVSCFVSGTRVLTQNGYKAVETLTESDRIVTSNGSTSSFKLMKASLTLTTEATAPYLIAAHAFGHNVPSAPVSLSPRHMIQMRKGLWTCPRLASKTNTRVKQYGIGHPITYYHIQCESYLRDNIITEGMIVESYGTLKDTHGADSAYTWSKRFNALTRMSAHSISKNSK